jgi:hypothetical protein
MNWPWRKKRTTDPAASTIASRPPSTPAERAAEVKAQLEEATRELEARADAELRERIAASHQALVERIRRDGTDGAGFPDGPGLCHAERIDRIFAGWGRS